MKFHVNCSSMNRALTVLAVAAVVILPSCAEGASEDVASSAEIVEVKQGPLRIAVREGGELESGKPTKMRSQVEGRNAIIELVSEGAMVKDGEVVCKLDSAGLEDLLQDQQITVDKARSDFAQAKESHEIQIKKNEEDLKAAITNLELAQRALEGYKTHTLPLDKKKLESDHTVAQEELARAKTEAEASRRLFEKQIVPKTQLEADELGLKKAAERVEIAKRNLEHFKVYTSKDEVTKLTSDVEVLKIALERVRQQCSSNLVQTQDTVDTKKKNLRLETEQLAKYTEQLSQCVIVAPHAGLVVYARERSRHGQGEPVALGKEVRERETILIIPDLTMMVVQLEIHESSVKKVKTGQGAWVTVDALPGQEFKGIVTHVATVPSSQSSWMNPDLKVYEATVKLETTAEGIKPGMHAQVEILVDQITDAVQIPVQCVAQAGARSFVYVSKDGGDHELREIEVGLNNQSFVHVTKNLSAGEYVYLSRPKDAQALPKAEQKEFVPARDLPKGRVGRGSGGGGDARPMDDGNMRRPRGGARSMTDEQRAAMRKKLEGMTPEEQRAYMQKMFGGGAGRGGRGGGERGGRGGGERGGRGGGN